MPTTSLATSCCPAARAGQPPTRGDLAGLRRVLVVEGNEATRHQLQGVLAVAPNLHVDAVGGATEALAALAERPCSLVLTELHLPGMSGLQLIEAIREQRLPVAVIVLTGCGSIEEAVQALRLGACDFLTKPIDVPQLRLAVGRALRERALRGAADGLGELLQDGCSFHEMLSKSPSMRAAFELIRRVSRISTTVLIQGATGTGKELVARAIHANSPGRIGPLVAVNCAAVPETLLESELFGHEKGAFTSAVAKRRGRFELAHGGTLFLDEVGDIPAAMQAKLLRVLQERRFERVGGAESIEVDVRVVAATNRNLQKLVRQGKFREDLYYRLNVVRIDLPPLRDRPEDIPLLARHFAEKYATPARPAMDVSPEAMGALLAYDWPGNIRQLENAIERACVLSDDGRICPEDLPPEVLKAAVARCRLTVDLRRSLAEQVAEITAAFEERYLRKALKMSRGNIGRTAIIAGVSPRTITTKVAAFKIDRGALKRE